MLIEQRSSKKEDGQYRNNALEFEGKKLVQETLRNLRLEGGGIY
jgi:hypothetical protein